jgi:tetratricopeptide (TPR) repeat protein
VTGKDGSDKHRRAVLAERLRAEGMTSVELAAEFRRRYRVNARVAFRMAYGWSQREVADRWNDRWPDDSKTLKNISYWELWPGGTGHAPTFAHLDKLAQLYRCSIGDLLADLSDYRDDDGPHRPAAAAGAPPLGAVDLDELARVILMWIQRGADAMSRRELLAKLSAACAVTAAAPLFDALTPDEYEHVAQERADFDEPTLRYCEAMTNNLRRQGDALGPRFTLHSAVGHRLVAERLAKTAPSRFQQRATSAYAELSQLLGWVCFNLGDYRGAQRCYDEARAAAHDAGNVELVTYVLCTMSHLATWQGAPRVGIDHAAAATAWARNASPVAQAYAADVSVRAYAADDQAGVCRQLLDREYATLQAGRPDRPVPSWWYFYDESFFWRTTGECELKFHRPEAAMHALDKSVTLVDPANRHNYTFRQLFRAEAHIQQGAVGEAVGIMGEVARLASLNVSARIGRRLDDLRDLLAPWDRTGTVRELDTRLAAYRSASGTGKSRTNRT